jgi:predicted restriction endonuclease
LFDDSPSDLHDEGQADRVRTQIYRILRDTKVARWVKFVHEYHCQICDTAILLPDRLYAEAHHIRPLGAGHAGPDVIENVLCVCPNHHAELDYGAMRLEVGAIRTARGHAVGEEFIEYHNRHVYQRRRRSG